MRGCSLTQSFLKNVRAKSEEQPERLLFLGKFVT